MPGEMPSIDAELAKSLTDYAGIWRYQAPLPIPLDEKAKVNQAVVTLRAHVLRRLSVLRPGIDWAPFA